MGPCFCIVSHSFFGPPLNQFQTKITHTILDLFFEILSMRPVCKHHGTPMKSPDGISRTFVMCPKGTKWTCCGCTIDLGDIFPVCPIDIQPQCFASMHRMRTNLIFYTYAKNFLKKKFGVSGRSPGKISTFSK